MLENQAIEKTFKGTWREILLRQDEIPDTSEVEVRIIKNHPEIVSESEETATLADSLKDLIEKAERLIPGEPILNDGNQAFGDLLKNKFGEMGFKL